VSLEEHKRRERAQAIGLFRYQLICPALVRQPVRPGIRR
jgi:putative transposase